MNNLKKLTAATVICVMVGLTLQAQPPLKTWSRVDINAEKDRIKLTPVLDKVKGSNLFNAKWRKDKMPFYLSARQFFTTPGWAKKVVTLTFTPDKTGKAKLMFLGVWRSKTQIEQYGLPWFLYTNIKIDGKAIPFDDTAWTLNDGAKIITKKGPDGKDIQCIKAKCHSSANYMIDLVKGQIVTIEFNVKYLGAK